jgi:ribosomal protein L29
MSSTLTTKELRNQSIQDLERDVAEHRKVIRKMRIGIEMNTEKDTARYRREKRALGRMLTVLTQKQKESLSSAPKASTVSAPTFAPKGATAGKPASSKKKGLSRRKAS